MTRPKTANSSLDLLAGLVSQRVSPQEVPGERWPDIVDQAEAHGLGPVLFWNMKRAGANDFHQQERLASLSRQAAAHYGLLRRAQGEINAAFEKAGIPALWLKGAALAPSVYPDPALRPMGDLDVLVPYEQREQALGVLQGLGYDFYTLAGPRPRSSGDKLALKLGPHHYHLKGGIAQAVVVELHFRLLGQDDGLLPMERLEWFWDQRQTLRLADGATCDILKPEAHLLYLAAHAVLQHGEAQMNLLHFFDLHLLIAEYELDWDIVVEQAVTLGWTLAVERALKRAVEFFATPVPDTVFDLLVRRRRVFEDTSRVIRFQGPGHRWEHLRTGLAGLSTREMLHIITETLLPTPAYMRSRYQVKPGWPTWPYYVYRWFDQARDVCFALWKRFSGYH